MGDDLYDVNRNQRASLAVAAKKEITWATARSHGWYDFTIKSDALTTRLAGRVEDGDPSFSDPFMHV